MSKVRFELNRAGVRDLLRSQEAMNVCENEASRIAMRAGEGYEVTTHVGVNRVNASVMASTPEARRDNSRNNTLLKALGGGR